MEENKFNVIVLGIIFDPEKKKVLIGRRENDPYMPELTWCFPGGLLKESEDIDKRLKQAVKEKTGLAIKNLGAFFSKTYEEKENLLAVYFLTEIFEGEEQPQDDLVELKWVSPKELEDYFTTSYHRKLKQFMNDLVQ